MKTRQEFIDFTNGDTWVRKDTNMGYIFMDYESEIPDIYGLKSQPNTIYLHCETKRITEKQVVDVGISFYALKNDGDILKIVIDPESRTVVPDGDYLINLVGTDTIVLHRFVQI